MMSDSSDAVSHVTKRRRSPRVRVPTEQNQRTSSDVMRANFKVPPFSPDEPEIWFALLEGQFDNFGITDDHAKYTHVITNIDLQHAKAVKDIIVNPPPQERYTKIKTELIRRLSASHENKVRQLLTHEVLGDRKPSQFLRHLQDLAGPSVPEDFIRTIWSNRLPQSLQTILVSQPTHSLEQLADLADRVQEVTTPAAHNVASASTAYPGSSHSSDTRSEIAELRKMVERLELKLDRQSRTSHQPNSRSRPRRRSVSRPRSRSNSSYKKYPVCWYHSKFGDDAQNCAKPCNYKAGNAKSNR